MVIILGSESREIPRLEDSPPSNFGAHAGLNAKYPIEIGMCLQVLVKLSKSVADRRAA